MDNVNRSFEISEELKELWHNCSPDELACASSEVFELFFDNSQYVMIRNSLLKLLGLSKNTEINKHFSKFEIDIFRDLFYSNFYESELIFACMRVSLVEACAMFMLLTFLRDLHGCPVLADVRLSLLSFVVPLLK